MTANFFLRALYAKFLINFNLFSTFIGDSKSLVTKALFYKRAGDTKNDISKYYS